MNFQQRAAPARAAVPAGGIISRPMPAPPDLPPTRFRRHLLAVMLLTGLVPLLLLGAFTWRALEELLSFSMAPVEQVLDEVSAELERQGLSRAVLDETRLNL